MSREPWFAALLLARVLPRSRRHRYREALIRIAGTPTKNSSDEARDMAREAMQALRASKSQPKDAR